MKKKIDQSFEGCKNKRFEAYFEETKKVGLELLMTLQKFTMTSNKKTIESAFELILEYNILNDIIHNIGEEHQVEYLKKLNHSFKIVMEDLDLMETHNNIIQINKNKISSRFYRKRLGNKGNKS